MRKAKEYIKPEHEEILFQLKEFLSIKSISADLNHKNDITKAADFLKNALLNAGLENVKTITTGGNPVVYGDKIINAHLPTVLVYGHYDVQPADPINEWLSDPFMPEIREGRIYARGASDDKAQVYMIIKAIEALNKTAELPCNIKIVIEGEEEIGSVTFEKFVKENKRLLKADTLLVCDTAMKNTNTPTLISGLRGIAYFELELMACNKDLHSGIYGGLVINPFDVLVNFLSEIKHHDGSINIPGFYDGIKINSSISSNNLNSNSLPEDILNGTLKKYTVNVNKNALALKASLLPTLDINGVYGGYTGYGPKTIIPSKATAKFSMRLANGQDHCAIEKQLNAFCEKKLGNKIDFKLKKMAGCNAILLNTKSKSSEAASKALKKVFGNAPQFIFLGGTIPPVSFLVDELQLNPVLMGFGLENDNIHSPNESFLISNFFKGIECLIAFFSNHKASKVKELVYAETDTCLV